MVLFKVCNKKCVFLNSMKIKKMHKILIIIIIKWLIVKMGTYIMKILKKIAKIRIIKNSIIRCVLIIKI
jgi:hypothetical protein